MAHALAGSALGFGAARFALGIGESANFPAALKTVAHWFPRRERALATGIFNSGANIGALLVPMIVPYLVIHFGWRSAFLAHRDSGIRVGCDLVSGSSANRRSIRIWAPPELALIRSDHEASQSEEARSVP